MPQNFIFDACIAREGMEQLNKDVRRFGKMLRLLVKSFIAFLLFVLLNVCIVLLTKRTYLISAQTFHLLEEGLHVFINQSLVTFASIVSQRNTFVVLAFSIVCSFGAGAVTYAFVAPQSDDESDDKVQERNYEEQERVAAPCIVSYKQKVCFLS